MIGIFGGALLSHSLKKSSRMRSIVHVICDLLKPMKPIITIIIIIIGPHYTIFSAAFSNPGVLGGSELAYRSLP